jgi:hypothetical protein
LSTDVRSRLIRTTGQASLILPAGPSAEESLGIDVARESSDRAEKKLDWNKTQMKAIRVNPTRKETFCMVFLSLLNPLSARGQKNSKNRLDKEGTSEDLFPSLMPRFACLTL